MTVSPVARTRACRTLGRGGRLAVPWHDPGVTDWRAVLAEDDGYELRPGASEVAVNQAETLLGAVFPMSLRTLYLATDRCLR